MKKHISDRIKSRRRQLGLTQRHIAEKLSVTPSAVTQWESGMTEPKLILELSKILQCSQEWLLYGKGDPDSLTNVSEGPEIKGLVPLISWVQAGQWTEVVDVCDLGLAETHIACPAPHGDQTYALRVHGDSMTSPHGRTYPEGAIIYVDPDQNGSPNSGDRVIARLIGENAVTFKCYIEDSGRKFLKPLNPAYPIITEEFHILGKVIGSYMPE